MPWFVLRGKFYESSQYLNSYKVEAEDAKSALTTVKFHEMSWLREEDVVVSGPFEKEEAEIEAYDQNSLNPYKIEDLYRTLMNLATEDPHVRLSSKHVENPALKALMAWGKEPLFNKRVVTLLLKDAEMGEPFCHWAHLAALSRITDDKCVIPKSDYGRFNAIRGHWVKWGKEKGYTT